MAITPHPLVSTRGHIADHSLIAESIGIQVIATTGNFPGIDPTGSSDSSVALQASLDAVPDGGVWRLPPGTYLASGLTVTGKSVTFEMSGATLVQSANSVILRLSGGFESTLAVSAAVNTNRTYNSASRSMGQLTFASAPAWIAGDVVKVFSNDVVTEAEPGTGTTRTLRGEFATVAEIIGNDVFLMGPLRDTYSTVVRAARLKTTAFRVEGFTSMTPDASLATYTAQQLVISSAPNPIVNNMKVSQGGGIGINLISCYGYEVNGMSAGYLKNNAGAGQYGYAVCDNNCEGGKVYGLVARNVRHAFTDDSPTIEADSTSVSSYGRSRNATITNGRAYGCYDVAWNTHHAGEGHDFVDCQAISCDTGASFRGRYHRATRLRAIGCRVGVGCYTSSGSTGLTYGLEFDDCQVTGARLDAAWFQVITKDGRKTVTVRGGFYQSTTRALQLTRVSAVVERGARFVCMDAALTTNTRVVKIVDSTLRVDGIEVDMSGVTSGSTLGHFGLDDSSCILIGKDVRLVWPATTSRVPVPIVGTSGSTGTVTLRDVDLQVDPATSVMSNCVTGSRVAYFSPANVGGTSVTI